MRVTHYSKRTSFFDLSDERYSHYSFLHFRRRRTAPHVHSPKQSNIHLKQRVLHNAATVHYVAAFLPECVMYPALFAPIHHLPFSLHV